MQKKSLLELLQPVRARLTLFAVSRFALIGFLAGSAVGLVLLAASRIWPLLHVQLILFLFVVVGLAAGIVFGWMKRVTLKGAARTMDRHDTEDAITTALDGLMDENKTVNPIILMQREAATEAAERYVNSLRARLPWPSWRSWRVLISSTAAVWLVTIALLVIPNPLAERAEALAQAKDRLQELEREAERLAEQAEAAELPKDAQQQLLEPLEELRSKLDAPGSDSPEVLEQLAEAISELEEAAQAAEQAVKRMETAASAMNQEPGLRQLGQALQDRDAAGLRQAIDDLRSQLQRMSPEQREALAEALERLAADQPQEERAAELAAALEQAAQQARAAEDGAAGEAAQGSDSAADGLAALEEALARELSQGELEQLARAMAGQLGQSGQQLAAQLAAQGGTVPPAWSGAVAAGGGAAGNSGGTSGTPATGGQGSGQSSTGSGSASDPNGQGSGAGSAASPGTGAGAGNGAGSGSGSGSGAGSGSGNGSGQGQGSGQGAGLGAGSRGLVTTPRDMAGSGNVMQDGGPASGGQVESGGVSPMLDGATRPYEEVYSEYATEAKEALGRSQLPESMQEKVKAYFEQIQPNR